MDPGDISAFSGAEDLTVVDDCGVLSSPDGALGDGELQLYETGYYKD